MKMDVVNFYSTLLHKWTVVLADITASTEP